MESRRSFVSRMNPCGLSAEKGCYIFAIFNMLFISTCLSACIYYVKWARNRVSPGLYGISPGFEFLFSLVLAFMVTVSFVFAVLLCFGVHKKRPSYIQAYFIYGVIEKIIALFVLLFIWMSSLFIMLTYWRIALIAVLVIDVIYSLLLIVVYRAYRAMSFVATDTYKLMDVPLA